MARLTLARRLLTNTLLRVQYQVLDPGIRHVWDVLLGLMEEADDRVLRPGFGLGSEAGFAAWVSLWVSVSVTHAETSLHNLVAAGLLVERDGCLMPPSTASTRRADTARANGARGGRPRKQAVVPGQGDMTMRMPIPGGLAKPGLATPMEAGLGQPAAAVPETQDITQTGSGVSAQLASLSIEATAKAELASPAVAEGASSPVPAFVVAQHALAIAQLNPEKNRNAIEVVTRWLGLGLSPERITALLAGKLRVMNKRGKQAQNLTYFDQFMTEQSRMAPAQAALPIAPASMIPPIVPRLPPSLRNRGLDTTEELLLVAMLTMHAAGERERLVVRASMNRTKAPRAYQLLVELHPEVGEWVEGDRRAVA